MPSKITFDKLKCKSFQQRFSEYVDGLLPETERLEIHEHLKVCVPCSKELDHLCKTLQALADFREECLPAAIQTYRLPRSTFLEIFPTIQEEKLSFPVGSLVPYLTAVVLFFLVLSTWDVVQRHAFAEHFNDSNYVEVIGKI